MSWHMHRLLPLIVALAPLVFAEEQEINVNSRYTVESVEVAAPQKRVARLSQELRGDVDKLVGTKVDQSILDDLGKRLRKELKAHTVVPRIVRGNEAEHVKVVFEASWHYEFSVRSDETKFSYHSKQGFTGHLIGSSNFGKTTVGGGVVSDGDTLVERYAGLRAYVRRNEVFDPRVKLSFDFETYHTQWNNATLAAGETYRTRYNFQPAMSVELLKPLTLTVGASFTTAELQVPAAHKISSNSAITSLRYRGYWEDSGVDRHDLTAGYTLRAATRSLDSDYVFARQSVDATYRYHRGSSEVVLRFAAGHIGGRAPLYERFVAGNTTTLRGWNKYDLAPLGGDNIVGGAMEYRYRFLQVFYDTGAVWDRGQSPDQKNSAGIGVRKGGLQLAVAFPLRSGHIEPVLLIGMDF